VTMGDNTVISAVGKGKVFVTMHHDKGDTNVCLSEVYFVPDLAKNLLTPNPLIAKGYEAVHNLSGYTLYNPLTEQIFFQGKPLDGLIAVSYSVTGVSHGNKGNLSYPVSLSRAPTDKVAASPTPTASSAGSWRPCPVVVRPPCPTLSTNGEKPPPLSGSAATKNPLDPNLLHQRFGHLHSDLLSEIVKAAGIPTKVTRDSLSYCEACVRGKLPRQRIGKGSYPPAVEVGMLVDTDICGPMEVVSREGYRFYVSFIDNHSRFARVYFLKYKSELFQAFQHYHQWLRNQFGVEIKALRGDPAGENRSNPLRSYLNDNGIELRLTSPNTPEENPIAERFNRVILEGVRTLLLHSGMPRRFWVDAARFMVFLYNRTPRKILNGESPYQRLYQRDPSFRFLRVFGCHGHVLRPKKLRVRRKTGPKTDLMVYLGPDEGGSCFRMWNPATNREVRSREVNFDEFTVGLPKHQQKVVTFSNPSVEVTRSFSPPLSTLEDKEPGEDTTDVDSESDTPIPPQQPGSPRPTVRRNELNSPNRPSRPSPHLVLPPSPPPVKPPKPEFLRSNSPLQDLLLRRSGRVPKPTTVWEPKDPPPLSARKLALKDKNRRSRTLEKESESSESDSEESFSLSANAARQDKDPASYKEAISCPEAPEWLEAMSKEFYSLLTSGTLSPLTELPPGRKAIRSKWVFKQKYHADGTKDRKKARLVARGDQQQEGKDFDARKIFAPVIRHEDLRSLLAFAVAYGLDIIQMDVDAAYLQANLDEEIYLAQPEGFIDPKLPLLVYLLLKSLYGLKQAGKLWNKEIDEYLRSLGFLKLSSDPCVYVLRHEDFICVIGLYVDDNVLVGHTPLLRWVKQKLSSRFPMKDLGPAKSLLGMQILYQPKIGTLALKQSGFILEILDCYGMSECNPACTPMEHRLQLPKLDSTPPECTRLPYREAIGKLLYLAIGTRPDISFAVNYLSRFVTGFNDQHWKALLRVLRYLRGTVNHGILFSRQTRNPMILYGYGDADWGGDTIDRKSITGYVFFLNGGPISWRSRKQPTTATSSTEAEYLSASDSAKQAIHHRNFLNELGFPQEAPTTIRADNMGAIKLSENPCNHERTKHFDIRHHFIREKVAEGQIILRYESTSEMTADILTKALPRPSFEKFRQQLSVVDIK